MSSKREARLGVSGQYGGPISRLAGFALDALFISTAFTLISAALTWAIGLFTKGNISDSSHGIWWAITFIAWAFFYLFISLVIAGRTPGMGVVGLKVVDRNGSPLHARHAFIRVVLFAPTFLTLGLGWVGLFIGRERRALYDVVAGTVVVYDWGDRPAELPTPLSRFIARAEPAVGKGHVPPVPPIPATALPSMPVADPPPVPVTEALVTVIPPAPEAAGTEAVGTEAPSPEAAGTEAVGTAAQESGS